MNYFKQVLTVTWWEYTRFYKLKNELIGIATFLAIFLVFNFGSRFISKTFDTRHEIAMLQNTDPLLAEKLEARFDIKWVSEDEISALKHQMEEEKEGMLLRKQSDGSFVLFAYKQSRRIPTLENLLHEYTQLTRLAASGIDKTEFEFVMEPPLLEAEYIYEPGRGQRPVLAYFFVGLMVMAIFLSFAYQFTAITGEKMLKITEQIVSAIKPQVWMDGKILGITLTGLSSMITYIILSILGGMVYFIVTGASAAMIIDYLHVPAITLFLAFTLMGILMWNAIMAAIASIITDPNNSGKSSLMMFPVVFVILTFAIIGEPDSSLAVFLSWFPLTSPSAMPIRWVATEVYWYEVLGSLIVLTATFYFLRKLAAKIFRITILISGKEPTWTEVWKMAREK